MQDDIPKNPNRQRAMRNPDVENTRCMSVVDWLARARASSREFIAECEELIARVATTSPHEALLCELMLVSGLELSEALNFKPLESITPDGLLIKSRETNGRSRLVPFAKLPRSLHRQCKVYSRCLQHSVKISGNTMRYEGLSKDQSYRRFERTLAVHYISTSSMQITYQDLRLAYARLMFEECIGYRQTAESQNTLQSMLINYFGVQPAIKAVMQALGYSPPTSTFG